MIFRYPGSKKKLLGTILPGISEKLETGDNIFHDVFIGGGSVSIALAKKYPNLLFKVNDYNKNIYSFWKLISEGAADEINALKGLVGITPTVDLFYKFRSEAPTYEIERAYYAIFFNRCTFSGIEMAGPIGGTEQKSKWTVGCRYNANKINKQIDDLILLFKGRLQVFNYHCVDYLKEHTKGVFYLDPPYFLQGKNLYKNYMNESEHLDLQKILKNRNDYILSYDNCDFIKNLYKDRNISYIDAQYCINGKKENWNSCKELLIT